MGGYMKYTGHCGGGCHYGHPLHHHHYDGRMPLLHCEGELVGQIPVLRYLKEPVRRLEDLYSTFPLGGQPGDFAFVYDAHCFAYWHQGENKWKLITMAFTAEDLIRNLGLRFDKLRDGHVLMWSEDAGGFVLYAIRTVTDIPVTGDLDGLYLVVGKGVWTVEGGVVRKIITNATWASILDKPTVQEFQSDWDETDNTSLSFIRNKPSMPEVNNAKIYLYQGGVLKDYFCVNQAVNKNIELDIGGDSFSGNTLVANQYANVGSVQISFTLPAAGYDDVVGKFTSSSLMRLSYSLNPFGTTLGSISGLNVELRAGSITGTLWPLKRYSDNSSIKTDELFFKPYIYMRYDAATDTLFTE